MRQPVGISVAALSLALLVGTAGCTRTSDGSVVLRKPAMLSRVFGRKPASVPQVAPPVYAQISPPQTYRRAPARKPKITVPAMSIVKNPPFQRDDPDKPLSCVNETSPSGRIRVVCL